MDFFFNYAEANIVCVLIFGIMLIHDLRSVDRQERQIKYDHALISFMLYFISDILWAGVDSGVLPVNRFSVIITNVSNYLIMVAITYNWLQFVMAYEQTRHRNRLINKIAVALPFIVSTAALVITYLAAPQVLLNENLELQPAYIVFMVAVPYVYILSVIIYAVRMAIAEENPIEKKRHLYIGLFPLIVIVGGLAEMVFMPDRPIFCFCCTLLMLMFYIQSMESRISIDPLTGLNNRGQLMHYISQKNSLYLEGKLTFVVMMDINGFKAINDTYGHAEGDKALVLIADSFRKVIRHHSFPIFLARYGGDEFIMIAHPSKEQELLDLNDEIRRQITADCHEEQMPYSLTIGIGCDRLGEEPDNFSKCMQRADHKLYLDKEYVKLHS